jgi:corrinoid protein of di/trimethylamine methyltransferase
MATSEREKELQKKLHDAVLNMNKAAAIAASNEAVAEGASAYRAIMDGLAAGMQSAGKLFEDEEYFVPELLMCSEALYAGLDILRPHVRKEEVGTGAKGDVVIGVVRGDIHDIAKNLVKLMFEVAGFSVHDLGRDVPLEKFAEEQLRTDSELVALSTMMTTTMPGMKRAIEIIRERNPNVKIMIGGAPVSQKAVEAYGADSTANNATNALREAIKLISQLREMEAVRTPTPQAAPA